MLQRSLLYGVVMLILLGLAISAGQWDKDTTLLQQHADEISADIKKQAEEADSWSKQNLNSGVMNKTDFSALLKGQTQAFTVVAHREDSIIFWSNNKIIPSTKELTALKTQSGFQILNLPSGWFAAKSETAGNDTKTTLIPIRYGVSSSTLFSASKYIPSNVNITTEKTPYEITVNGKPLAWLKATGSVQAAWLQWVKLIAWGLFLFTLIAFIHKIASTLSEKRGLWAGGLLVILSVLAITLLNSVTGFTTQQFGALPAFSQQFEDASFIGRSLGDWLLHILLLIWVMVFTQHRRKEEATEVGSVPDGLAIGTSTGAYLLIMGCMLIAAEVFRQLIFHSALIFDFDNLLGMGSLGFLALAGIVAFMVAMFLFSHRMALVVKQFRLDRNKRLVAFGVAGAVFAVLAFLLSGQLSPLYLIVYALVYALMFDAYVHWDSTGFGWVLCWLLLFSMFSSSLLYRYNKIKDGEVRMAYAKNLVDARDTSTTEKILPAVIAAIQKDTQNIGNLLKPWPFKARKAEINAAMYQQVMQQEYLFQHYRPEINAYDKERQSIIVGQTLDYAGMQQYWDSGVPVSGSANLRGVTDETGKFAYITKLNTLRMGDPSQPAQVYIAFRHEYPSATNTYARMFFQAPYKGMDQLSRYDFAVRSNGQLVVEQGLSNPGIWNTTLEKGKISDVENLELGRSDAVAISQDGNTMATVGRVTGGWYKEVYLFALLFSLATFLLFALSFFNAYLHFLPAEYNLRLSTNGSLAKRIHFWNIMLLAISFVVVGYLTYRHFTHTHEENERSTVDYKSQAMLLHLKSRALGTAQSGDSLGLGQALPQYLNSIASSLSSDANLYSKEGSLVYTTQPELAHIGLIPSKMNAAAWAALNRNAQAERTTSDQSAGIDYATKYLSLRNGQNQLLGFIGVPYQLNDAKLGPEVSDFIGMLASLYVFLLLIAFAVTFVLSRSIIKPLRLLSENVKTLRLEDKNEPLQYSGDSQDEVGELIGQYNTMVDKLEASKVQMVRLEREGAWREMAKQVAHDIKNPLTTMKLSMQQLERVSNNPEQAAAYLRKAITRLIEQIDSLAQIASEFSMFANLDIRNKSEVVVNEVVENVHDLFSEHKNVDLDLQLPSEKLNILGDKNHLIRVFNNLIINAIQSIPSDRRGVIHVSVYRKAESAEIKISDNGGGIPPEIRDRVFEPNFTTKTSGSGLGLAICKKIIEAHDGEMRFETRDNEGTDFFVEIPISSVGLQLKFP